jgi:Flp pilus assembly protein TadB
MDISAVVVVIILTALFLGAIVWMEMHSRKRRSIERLREARSSEINRKQKAIYENR